MEKVHVQITMTYHLKENASGYPMKLTIKLRNVSNFVINHIYFDMLSITMCLITNNADIFPMVNIIEMCMTKVMVK